MKSQMWVVVLAVVLSYALSAPTTTTKKLLTTLTTKKQAVTTVTTAKPQPIPTNPGLEIQELIVLRDFYKDKNSAKSKEYADRVALKKANLYNLALAASKLPNFDESLYSTDPFFREHHRDEEPAIQKYRDKINYYQEKMPYKFIGHYRKAKEDGMDVEFKQDGSPHGSPVNVNYAKAQDFYDDLWRKRNLPYTPEEYRILIDHWQELLNQRIELDKVRGPSQAELYAYHKYLQGPEPAEGFTLPPWITTTPAKKWVLVEFRCGAGVRCTRWEWE